MLISVAAPAIPSLLYLAEPLVTRTLLLDLDDTLLGNEIDTFVTVYSKLLAEYMAPYVDPNLLIKNLFLATRYMLQNQRPDKTLADSFDSVFYPALGIEKNQIKPVIDHFYHQMFPGLKSYTQFWPAAPRLVEEAIQRGYQIGIATNPLFPRLAILHRLSWAGLPVEKYPFILISSYETFHFAKPNPAFFAEFLAKVGWPEGPVIMAGDTLDNDITAARQMGLTAYWLPKDGQKAPEGPFAPSATGTQAEILPWLDSIPQKSLEPDFSGSLAYLAILRSTPATLDSLAREVPLDSLFIRPQAGEWSLVEIICHLRDVDTEVNLPRMQQFIQDPNPFLPGKDTDRWAEERNYISQDPQEALKSFISTRVDLINLLDQLSLEDWKRPARHAIFGPTHLQEMVGIIAGHDRLHIQQIHQVLKQTHPPVHQS